MIIKGKIRSSKMRVHAFGAVDIELPNLTPVDDTVNKYLKLDCLWNIIYNGKLYDLMSTAKSFNEK